MLYKQERKPQEQRNVGQKNEMKVLRKTVDKTKVDRKRNQQFRNHVVSIQLMNGLKKEGKNRMYLCREWILRN